MTDKNSPHEEIHPDDLAAYRRLLAGCPDCIAGRYERVMLDEDGVLTSVSGKPGRWGHSVDEFHWYCTDAGAIAENKRLREQNSPREETTTLDRVAKVFAADGDNCEGCPHLREGHGGPDPAECLVLNGETTDECPVIEPNDAIDLTLAGRRNSPREETTDDCAECGLDLGGYYFRQQGPGEIDLTFDEWKPLIQKMVAEMQEGLERLVDEREQLEGEVERLRGYITCAAAALDMESGGCIECGEDDNRDCPVCTARMHLARLTGEGSSDDR